jgi:hypothetical protein
LNYTRRGFSYSWTSHGERVDETDTYARTLLDILYQGLDIEIETICRIYASAALAAFWPWGSTIGTVSTAAAPIARRGTDTAASLVLTVVANTPAAGNPNTITASLAILAPEQNQQLIFSSQARDVPIRWTCLPSESGGTATKLTLT